VVNSENLKEAAETLKRLQEEWKSIGPVHDRFSNKIWKRFRTACDTFFERKNAAQAASKNELEENLQIKLDLISQLEAIAALDKPGDHSEEFDAIQVKWKETGHVPFKQKDRINGAYRDALSQYFDKTRNRGGAGGNGGGDRHHSGAPRNSNKGSGERRGVVSSEERRGSSAGAQGRGNDKPTGNPATDEIRRIKTRIQTIQEKVDAYETNILLISRGKSSDSLRNQIQSQIDSEKAEIERLKKKIQDIKAAQEQAAANPPAKASEGERENSESPATPETGSADSVDQE
jgi:vacuolar-type H+-ATPase subunit I/STV1